MVKWTFKDGTVQEVKQEEHSVDIFPLLMLLSYRNVLIYAVNLQLHHLLHYRFKPGHYLHQCNFNYQMFRSDIRAFGGFNLRPMVGAFLFRC